MSTFCGPQVSGIFRSVSLALLFFGVAGCASLPVSGPTGVEVRHAATTSTQYPFTLLEIDSAAAIPAAPGVPTSTLAAALPRPTDLLGPGDVLNITVYEAGVSLFGTSLRAAAAGDGAAMALGIHRQIAARPRNREAREVRLCDVPPAYS